MKYFSQSIFKTFITIFIPILLLWVVLIAINLDREEELIIDNTISELEITGQSTSIIIENYLSKVIENIKVVRDANEVQDFVNNPTESNKVEMTNLFYRIMENKQDYYQIIYLDTNGNEFAHLENIGSIEIFDDASLQSQKLQSYFEQGLSLKKDEIFMSYLDLDFKNSLSENSKSPVITFTSSIYDDLGQIAGLLVITYDANTLVSLMNNSVVFPEFETNEFYLLNANADCIVHSTPYYNFSFLNDDMNHIHFTDDYLDFWNDMSKENFIGHLQKNDHLLVYRNLLDGADSIGLTQEDQWISVYLLDYSNLTGLSAIIKQVLLVNNLIIGLIILIVTYLISLILNRLQEKNLELDIAQKIATSTNDSVIITDSKTKITYVNDAYEKSTGYKREEVLGMKPSNFKSGKHGKDFYQKMWQSINSTGEWEGNLWDKRKDGLLYPKKLKIMSIYDKKTKKPHHYVGVFSSLSTTKNKSDTYDILNYRNGQMLVPNEEIMIELLDHSVNNKQQHFMVVNVVIENFTQLSNLLGDRFNVTEMFTNLIKPELEKNDFIAQTGRNLFAIVISLDNITRTPKDYISDLHKKISKVFEIDGMDIFFKSRIGVSYWPDDTADLKKLLLYSMIALEWTSHRNESEIAFFENHMIDELNQENKIESYLRKAIKQNEFFMVYQPQVDIQTEEIIGMEALLRWNNKELGFISPAIFIPIAEKNHLMIEIGDWILSQVCKDLTKINQHCKSESKRLRCAINLSPMQIEEVGFYDKLLHIIDTHKIPYAQLEMEITENIILSNQKQNIQLLEEIRNIGMTVAIDDFGTGYSSLSYLNMLPIDKIKVDRSFIKNYPDHDDGKLSSILINMSKTLGLKVLTEGAETKEQVDYLRKEGCNYIQGYYYSKPLALDDFLSYVDETWRK